MSELRSCTVTFADPDSGERFSIVGYGPSYAEAIHWAQQRVLANRPDRRWQTVCVSTPKSIRKDLRRSGT